MPRDIVVVVSFTIGAENQYNAIETIQKTLSDEQKRMITAIQAGDWG